MSQRKVDWIIEEWNKETDLPDEVKKVMYDLYTQDQDKDNNVKFTYENFFDLDLSFVTIRKKYYRKAIILLRKDKINKIKNNINEQ